MKSLVLLACLLSSLAWSAGIKKKDLSTTEYFRLFDYKNHSLTKEIFDFEKKLIEQAYLVEAYLQKNPTYKAPKKKYSSHVKLAMNLVYASMMILNNNNAVQENHVSLKDLTQATVLTDGSNLRQEMIARYNLSQRFLELAVKTAPDD